MAQKLLEFFIMKPREQLKVNRSCIPIATNETEGECLTGPILPEKRVKKTCRMTKKENQTKDIIEKPYNFQDFHEMLKYDVFLLMLRSFVEECHVDCSL